MATSGPVTPIQILRSKVLNKRPDPNKMLEGQPAVNINASQPGLFFADSSGSALIKIGPCSVGTLPPNDPGIAPIGASGNSVGELWLDTSSTFDRPGPTLKVYGSRIPGDPPEWIDCMPYRYANTIVDDIEPNVNLHPDGTLWWNSGTGLMYVLYNDTQVRVWTQVSSTPVQ